MLATFDKREWRRTLFTRVKGIGGEARAHASLVICDRLINSFFFQSSDTILLYAALASEPDLWSVFDAARELQKTVLFTAIEEDEIVLYEVRERSDLIPGDFGLLVPDSSTCSRFDQWETLDLIVVPGVGFDLQQMARLGRGKGHYDRFLERVRTRANPKIVGVCFGVQLESVPVEEHDQPMDHIVSEAGIDNVTSLLGLGANLGNRAQTMSKVKDHFNALGCSSLYESEPIDCEEGTPNFLNAVIRIESRLGPFPLLRESQQLEVQMGRPSDHGFHTPRTVDIDLLFCGECDFNLPELTLPHPEIANRRFVLDPLREVIATAEQVAPGLATSLIENTSTCQQELRKLDADW